MSQECLKIARDEKLAGYDLGNALLASLVRFAELTNIMIREGTLFRLVTDFARQAGYIQEEQAVVRRIIDGRSRAEAPVKLVKKVV